MHRGVGSGGKSSFVYGTWVQPQIRINIIMKTYFPGTQKSSILVVLAAPGAPETTPKGGALRAPPSGEVSGAPGAVQTLKIDDFWVPEEYILTIISIRSGGYPGPG